MAYFERKDYVQRNLWLQSSQVKRTPQDPINEFIIQKLNPLVVVEFRSCMRNEP